MYQVTFLVWQTARRSVGFATYRTSRDGTCSARAVYWQSKVSFAQLAAHPIASTPLSEETARILVERYGENAHPAVLVKYTSDEISHLIQVTERTDAVLLAIRACAPEMVEVQMEIPLKTKARFGLVTIASKSEPLFLPEIHKLMDTVMR